MAKTKKLSRPNKKTVGVTYRGVSLNNVRFTNDGTWSYKFRSRIGNNGEQLYLGSYSTAEEAAEAYNSKARSLFTTKRAQKKGMWNYL